MPEAEVLATGEGEYRLHDPDTLRAWMRDHKRRDLGDKTTTAADAVGRLVADGDYVSFDFSSFTRGPLVLILFGNINSTMLGDDWRRPKRRFPGSGGANEVASYCWRTIVIMMHEPRRFVPRVDFITSPGYLDGMPEARERAGLPAGNGPWRVVTSKALFGFDESTHEMTQLGVLEGLSPDEAVAELGVKPRVAARVERLAPPSARETEILRDHIDPGRTVIGRTAKN